MSKYFTGVSGINSDGTVHMEIEPATQAGDRAYFNALRIMRIVCGCKNIRFHEDHVTGFDAYHTAHIEKL